MCKKIIALFSTIIIIFNVIFPGLVMAKTEVFDDSKRNDGYGGAYGESSSAGDMQMEGGDNEEKKNHFDKITDEGKADVTQDGGSTSSHGFNISDNSTGALVKGLFKFLNLFPTFVRWVLGILTYDKNDTEIAKKYGKDFSIEKTVFNKVAMFDVNFLHRDADEDPLSGAIKDQVSKYFYITRNISIALMLLVLLYTGIRMAMSTIASDIAKYKTMIKDWVVSIIILFTLQYFMSAILWTGAKAAELCDTIMGELIENDDEYKIEEKMLEEASTSTKKGFSVIIPSILYWMLTYYQVKFFLMYMRRLVMMAFLVTIGPFISVSYAIDKARRWTSTSSENVAFRICNGSFNTAIASIYIYDIYANSS